MEKEPYSESRMGLLRITLLMYKSTTAVPQKLRTVQEIKSNQQKGFRWFL